MLFERLGANAVVGADHQHWFAELMVVSYYGNLNTYLVRCVAAVLHFGVGYFIFLIFPFFISFHFVMLLRLSIRLSIFLSVYFPAHRHVICIFLMSLLDVTVDNFMVTLMPVLLRTLTASRKTWHLTSKCSVLWLFTCESSYCFILAITNHCQIFIKIESKLRQ